MKQIFDDYTVEITAKCKIDALKPWIIHPEKKELIKISYGFLIKIDNTVYVLTCFHCVNDSYKIQISKKNIKLYATVMALSEEMDLALLKLLDNTYNWDGYNLIIRPLILNSDIIIYFNDDKFECQKATVEFDCQTSLNIPPLPFIELDLTILVLDIDNLISIISSGGISGIAVFDNGSVVGVVSNIKKQSKLSIIPIVTIMRFINEYTRHGRCFGLCNIVADTSLIEIDQEKHALYISNTWNINYNQDSNKVKGMKLINNDIIVSINDNEIDTKGYVYDSNLDLYIPFSTYIALNYIKDDMIKLYIYRKSKKDGNYNLKKINIKARPVSTMKYVPILQDNDFIELNGYVFIELSEQLIEYYRNSGIILEGKMLENYVDTPYTNDNKKVVVLIDIMINKISRDDKKMCNKLCLPLIKIVSNSLSQLYEVSNSFILIGDQASKAPIAERPRCSAKDMVNNRYTVAVLSQIGKHYVTSLKKMRDIIGLNNEHASHSRNILYFSINNRKKQFRMQYYNNKLTIIKKI